MTRLSLPASTVVAAEILRKQWAPRTNAAVASRDAAGAGHRAIAGARKSVSTNRAVMIFCSPLHQTEFFGSDIDRRNRVGMVAQDVFQICDGGHDKAIRGA
jgi:hypothetical protein